LRGVAGIVFSAVAVACSIQIQRSDSLGPTRRPQPASAMRVTLAPYFRGLRTASISINGADYTFLVDTGGGRTLITPEVASALGCTPRGRDVGYRMSGEAVIFQNCPRLQGLLSSFPIDVAPVAVFDLNSLLPAELPRLHGVLALDSFRGQIVTLDWAQNVLIVHSAADGTDAITQHGLPIRVATGETGAALSVLVPVQDARDQMWFLLDSGDIKGTLVDHHALEDDSIQVDPNSTAQLRVGNNDREPFQITSDEINYDGVLGTQFLQTHVVTLDLRSAP